MWSKVMMAVVAAGIGLAAPGSARAAGGTPGKRDLVLVGKILSIKPGGDSLFKRWVVTVNVEKVVSGKFSDSEFVFSIHSPSRSGLKEGRTYTIRAVPTHD